MYSRGQVGKAERPLRFERFHGFFLPLNFQSNRQKSQGPARALFPQAAGNESEFHSASYDRNDDQPQKNYSIHNTLLSSKKLQYP